VQKLWDKDGLEGFPYVDSKGLADWHGRSSCHYQPLRRITPVLDVPGGPRHSSLPRPKKSHTSNSYQGRRIGLSLDPRS
jgi:hypothetical protein